MGFKEAATIGFFLVTFLTYLSPFSFAALSPSQLTLVALCPCFHQRHDRCVYLEGPSMPPHFISIPHHQQAGLLLHCTEADWQGENCAYNQISTQPPESSMWKSGTLKHSYIESREEMWGTSSEGLMLFKRSFCFS